ncbi:MAG: AEC family transporter [Pseudomonadota bacterium]|nr:AEC family transporter [Pseudomonadota bacterium]
MIIQLFSIIAPVFLGVAFGFVWSRLQKPFDEDFVTSLVFNLGTPLLVFSTLTRLEIKLDAFSELALVMVVALILFFIFSFFTLKLLGLKKRTYLATIMIPNTGNVGLPLCFFSFGELGLAFGIIIYTIVSLTQFTFGVAMSAGTFSFSELSKNPLIYAVLMALLVMTLDYQLPSWIANTVHIFGQFAIPLMLIMLGVSLAKLKGNYLPRNLALSFIRSTMGLTVGLLVSYIFDLEGVARGVIVLQCSMPAAVFNYMLAMKYQNNPGEVAGLVVTSTIFSFVTLPFLVAFVLSL